MTQFSAIWRASLRSTSNAMRRDSRARLAVLFGLSVQLVLGIWAVSHLIPMFAQWKTLGSEFLAIHLWLTCLLAWPALILFAILATLMYGVNGEEALLLATQPIEPATRLRALYSVILWRGIGNWLLFEAGLLGIALFFALGWSALTWLLILVLGAACVAWLSLLGTLLVMRYVMPRLARIMLYGAALAGAALLLALLARPLHWHSSWTSEASALFAHVGPFVAAPLTRVVVASCLLLLLLLAFFPLAGRAGLLYLTVLQERQGHDSSARAFYLPGVGGLLTLLGRWRTPLGALLVKGLLQQSRSLFTWLRLLALVVLFALFPLLRPQLAALHLDAMLQVTLYAAGIGFLALLEYAPYAIGSEGARLTLYLVAPFDIKTFLRARLCSYLLPALLVGWLAAILLGIETRLNIFSLIVGLALLSLILIGYVALTMLGSALDADLTQVVEDNTQALILEEFPITPRRLQLLALTLLLFSAMLTLCWKLPLASAFLILAVLDVLLFLVGGRISRVYLSRLEQ